MKISRAKLKNLIREAMYNPDSYPQQSGIPSYMLKGGSVEKPADPSKPGEFTPGQLAQKVSSYSEMEDGFEPAINLATMADLEPAVVKMRGGYKNLKKKALRRIPDVLVDTLDGAQSLGFEVSIVKDVQSIPGINLKTPENRKVFLLEKHYDNELNNKLAFHIRYDPDLPGKEGPKGKGSIYTPQQSLIYCNYVFELDENPSADTGYGAYSITADHLIDVITAYDAVFEQGDAVDPMGVYSKFEDQLIVEAIDYVNLNIDEIKTERKTPEDIARLILEDYNFIYDTLYAVKYLETKLPKNVLLFVRGFVENMIPERLYYTIERFAEKIEDIFYDKGLGEIISEAYVGFPDKPPVKASKFLDDYELPEKYDEKIRTNLKSLMGSEDRTYQNTGLSAALSLDPDNEILQTIDAAGGYNFTDKDDGPLDKTEASKQSFLAALENARPFVGKKIESYIIYASSMGDDEIDNIVLNGDALDQIYGLLEEGKNTEAKEVAANYLDTEFLNDNYEAIKEMFPYITPDMTKLGITDFSDLCLNHRKSLQVHIAGLLPQDFDLHTYHQRGVDVITEIVRGEIGKTISFKIPPGSGQEVSKQVYKFVRRLGVLSQSFYSHPIRHHFYEDTPVRRTTINVH